VTRVAFLGLGAMGAPMAEHLTKSPFDLVVWNRTPEIARAFALRHRVRAALTPAEATIGADFAITCLPSSREGRELVESDQGLAAGLGRGSILIDCTSGDPVTSRGTAEFLSQGGVEFVDAPVSGGVKGAEAGTLTVMCGGGEIAVRRAREVLTTFAGKIVRCGEVGSGHAVKAMNQALLAIHIWSTGECLAALAKQGVDSRVALDVINGSSGRSNTSENLFPERVMNRAFPRTFRLALLDKDVAIASQIASDAGIDAPFIELAARLFSEAHKTLGDEADHVEAVRVIEDRAGVHVS